MKADPAFVANRWMERKASAFSDIVKELKGLSEEANALSDWTNSFLRHFGKTAAIDQPKVKSLGDAFRRASEGMERAARASKELAEMLKDPNPDPLVGKAKTAADKVVEKFRKAKEAAAKAVQVVAKKEFPLALKKFSAQVARAIKVRLEDPSDLQMIPWVSPGRFSEPGTTRFSMVLRAAGSKADAALELVEHVPGGVPYVSNHGQVDQTPSPESVADLFVEQQRGWGWDKFKYVPGMKERRRKAGEEIISVLDSLLQKMGSHRGYVAAPKLERNVFINGGYRSDLPKEGASEVGDAAYSEMVKQEIGRFRPMVDRALAPWKADIKKVDIHDGEKSWIYVYVELK